MRFALVLSIAGGALFIAGVSLTSLAQQESPHPARNASANRFMRAKVEAAHEVVTGLAKEDFGSLKTAGRRWLALAEESAWQKRRDPIFMHYSREFQRSAQRLVTMAEKENVEGATFAYINATVTCVACHRHVRGVVQVAPKAIGHSEQRRFQ